MKQNLILLEPGYSAADPIIQTLSALLGPACLASMDDPILPGKTLERIVMVARQLDLRCRWQAVAASLQRWGHLPVGLVVIGQSESDQAWLEVWADMLPAGIVWRGTCLADDTSQESRRAAIQFALELRGLRLESDGMLPAAELRLQIDDFIASHNTCALSTCYQGRVHSTPIEYHYSGGCIYMVSEGGEKFAGLLDNGRVSLAIFEPYRGFDHLAGLQLHGRAQVPPVGSPSYLKALIICGLSPDRIQRLPMAMHVISIQLDWGAFLCSGFGKLGYELRQVYHFQNDEA